MLAALPKEQLKPPSELAPEVPKELERIVLRCLRKEPDRRFQNMLDVKVELQEVKEESISSATAGRPGLRVRWRRRAWMAVAFGIAVVAGASLLSRAGAFYIVPGSVSRLSEDSADSKLAVGAGFTNLAPAGDAEALRGNRPNPGWLA
jgi:hypothetical protein